MQIDQYPVSKLERLLKAAQELAESNEIKCVKINQDRPVDIVNGKLQVVGPTITVITIESHYETP